MFKIPVHFVDEVDFDERTIQHEVVLNFDFTPLYKKYGNSIYGAQIPHYEIYPPIRNYLSLFDIKLGLKEQIGQRNKMVGKKDQLVVDYFFVKLTKQQIRKIKIETAVN